jgi:hypothetical protein
MRELRTVALIGLLLAGLVWAVLAWGFTSHANPTQSDITQRWVSVSITGGSGLFLLYFAMAAPKAKDELREVTGGRYFEADGVCFMPLVRLNRGRAEISLYYQNHHENPAKVIVHLRPPENTIKMREGARDIHFAFVAAGRAFGVIHQPIGVSKKVQGQVVDVELAAATWFSRGAGSRIRRSRGMPCGTLDVDWGSAMRTLDHEVAGEMNLKDPSTLHLAMPQGVEVRPPDAAMWTKERISLA